MADDFAASPNFPFPGGGSRFGCRIFCFRPPAPARPGPTGGDRPGSAAELLRPLRRCGMTAGRDAGCRPPSERARSAPERRSSRPATPAFVWRDRRQNGLTARLYGPSKRVGVDPSCRAPCWADPGRPSARRRRSPSGSGQRPRVCSGSSLVVLRPSGPGCCRRALGVTGSAVIPRRRPVTRGLNLSDLNYRIV